MGKFAISRVAMCVFLVWSLPASAESLTVSGWYAAEERSASMLRNISVDRFDGDDGPELVDEIERQLGAARDRDGGPYFNVRSRYAQTDGVVHGDVRVRFDLEEFTRKAQRCANNIASTKCKDKEKIEIDLFCVRHIVIASANLRITRLSDDARIYNRNLPERNETESCEGERKSNNTDSVVASLLRQIADKFANQITPFGRTEKIRIRESRTGMKKEEGNQMKSLISATKQNEGAACAGWREMESRGISHPTLSFNLGLCSESEGGLETALRYYRPLAAAPQNASDAKEAIRRIERRFAGEADEANRNRKPPS